MKSATVEKNHVTHVIHEIIFANPKLHMRYYVDQQLVLDYRGQGLAKAMEQIYNVDVKQLIAVNDDMDGIAVDGFISNIEFTV